MSRDSCKNVTVHNGGVEIHVSVGTRAVTWKAMTAGTRASCSPNRPQTLQNYDRTRGRFLPPRWCPTWGKPSHCVIADEQSKEAQTAACWWLTCLTVFGGFLSKSRLLPGSNLITDQMGRGYTPFLHGNRLIVWAGLLFCCLPMKGTMLKFSKLMYFINFWLLLGVPGWFHISSPTPAAFVLKHSS